MGVLSGSMETSAVYLTIVSEAFQFQRVVYLYLIILAIMVYDWLILLHHEIEYMWRGEWSVSKVLYIISRYGPFLDTPITIVLLAAPEGVIGLSACGTLFKVAGWSMILGLPVSESILLLRTSALYSKSKWITIPLSTLYAALVTAGVIISWRHKVVVSGPLLGNLFGACTIVRKDARTLYDLLLFLSFELVVVVLTIWRGLHDFHSGTTLLRVIYRDSILFFLALAGVTLSAILLLAFGPRLYAGVAIGCARVLHTIICCRILLNLRRAAKPNNPTTKFSSAIVFAAPVGQQTVRTEITPSETDDMGHDVESRGGGIIEERRSPSEGVE